MSRHRADLVMCRKLPGVSVGRLCARCEGRCVICDSYVNPCVVVRICDECNFGQGEGQCVVCGSRGTADAFYCRECVVQESDRDGCPRVVNLGVARMDLFYHRKEREKGAE
eukprot:TRINITY_DN2693_c0_g1_i2.p2 TRINITY_DN2693_c0_g1~~TRINITY_DN2693_c0_g1_i2.p2  ORF type:complete len:111 (+),score=3.44 TRINITY_DN2693_c0_g1_i2:73-405(+)